MLELIYCNHYGNEGGSSSVSDVDRYVIIWKLLNYISNILPAWIQGSEIQTDWRSFHKAAYASPIVQAVSRRLSTAAARGSIPCQDMWCLWWESGTRVRFLWVLRVSSTDSHSTKCCTLIYYHIVGGVPSGLLPHLTLPMHIISHHFPKIM
jgi:hypothetical protein